MTTHSHTLRLGARGSLLSRLQSGLVAEALRAANPGLNVETILIKTSGDQIQDRPLHEFGGKGLFTKELQLALLRKEIDFAVHSYKDVPVTMPLVDQAELMIAATPRRESPADVMVSMVARKIEELPKNARVGTGSLRRQAQMLAVRPDLQLLPIRGNVDTRLRKLAGGEYDAVILALAGLRRAGLFDPAMMWPLETNMFVPAAGQGALALECRRDDAPTAEILRTIHDPLTAMCVDVERAVVEKLQGDCHSPIAALAEICGAEVVLRAAVARRDGKPPVVTAVEQRPTQKFVELAAAVVAKLEAQGSRAMLAG